MTSLSNKSAEPSLHKMISEDFDVYDFARILEKLQEHLPISDNYDSVHGQKENVWWNCQKEHMIDWFSTQNTKGSGAFIRKKPNRSAKIAYTNLKCPGAYLWMAEALGEDDNIVQNAADAACAIVNNNSRCKAIRDHIPWKRILELAENHQNHSRHKNTK